jgi:hypothetical protein
MCFTCVHPHLGSEPSDAALASPRPPSPVCPVLCPPMILSLRVLRLSLPPPPQGLTSFDGTSTPSNASATLSVGSWGDPVCDGALFVYSATALLAVFTPSVTGSYAPSHYTLQVRRMAGNSSTSADVVSTTTVLPTQSVAGLTLPASFPSEAQRHIMAGLEVGVRHGVWVAPAPPALPVDLMGVLPSALAPVLAPLGACACASLRSGAGCGGAGAGTPVTETPVLPSIGAWVCLWVLVEHVCGVGTFRCEVGLGCVVGAVASHWPLMRPQPGSCTL